MAPKRNNLERNTFGQPQQQRRKTTNVVILSTFGNSVKRLVGKQASRARQSQRPPTLVHHSRSELARLWTE